MYKGGIIIKNDYCVKKNYIIFNISFIIRIIGVGIFNTLFNLYVFEAGFSSNFLSLFLSIGNLTMSLSSVPIGILIDKYCKKKLMIIFTLIGAICFLIQSIIKNEVILLFISAIYGFASIGLFTIIPPYLKQYDNTFKGRNLIAYNRSLNIFSSTIGALMCGFLSGSYFKLNTQVILILASVLYFVSIIPLFILSSSSTNNIINKKYLHIKKFNLNKRNIYLISIIVLFFFLGIATLITNYINLYFKNRFLLDISSVSYVYAFINLTIGIFIMIFSKVKIKMNKKTNKIFFVIILCILIIDIMLAFVEVLSIQIIFIFLLIALFECLSSYIYDLILSYNPSNIHGRISGIIQMSSNLSETLGIYICGILLTNYKFVEIHFISLFTTVFVCLALGLFFKCTKTMGR